MGAVLKIYKEKQMVMILVGLSGDGIIILFRNCHIVCAFAPESVQSNYSVNNEILLRSIEFIPLSTAKASSNLTYVQLSNQSQSQIFKV